ncbi:B12-binding domain-containing radical SAM protein [Acidobacteriota bacterium]
MRLQLFVPPGGYFAERWTQGSSMPPLGLLYIGAILEREGHTIQIVPADLLQFSWSQVAEEIRNFEPDLIGVTSTTENRFQSFKLVQVAKKACPKALTIMGGPHASMAAEDCLKHIPELDIVCRGEGEQTMLELCRELEGQNDVKALSSVAGISYKANGKVYTNSQREPIRDLDAIPRPAYHLIPFEKYNFRFKVPGQGLLPAVNMMSSRGCPFNCNFCATPINWGRAVRMRSPENIVEEIEFLISTYGVKVIFFFDDTFNTSPKRVHEICDLIIKRKLNIFFKCDIRIDIVSKALIEKMKLAGLFHLSFGLEAGSERVRNEVVNKKVNIDDFHSLVKWCQELDIIPNAFFIFSHPTETWTEAQETIDIIEKYKESIESSIAILHIYPGTPLEKTAKEMGMLPEDFTWTKRYRSKIITLPAAQGDVPLFVDKLKWSQVCELIFRWSLSGGKASVLRKIPQVLKNMRSLGDLRRYTIMAWVYIRLKLAKLFSSSK